MAKNLIYSHSIVSIGLVIFTLFAVAILLIGGAMNRTAQRMNNMVVVELCQNHMRILTLELNKAEVTSRIAHQFIATGDSSILGELYDRLTQEQLSLKSYAIITDINARILFHPDSSKIGTTMARPYDQKAILEVAQTGESQQTTVLSEYLRVTCERMFYPVKIGNDATWIAAINVPHLSLDNQTSNFRRYTLLIALLAVTLFSILLALSQARWRHEYELRRKAERESQELQLQQVIEQVNPHFLFNTLNSLYSLIGSDTTLAREFVLKLSAVYRYVLERGRNTLSPLDSEIEFTMKYYFLQKIRFEEQIEMRIDINPTMSKHTIPSMSLQTIVENAIKHNKITPQAPLLINIYTQGRTLVIENNYTPRSDNPGNSIGIGLERIRSIYNFYHQGNMEVTKSEKMFRCVLPLLHEQKSP